MSSSMYDIITRLSFNPLTSIMQIKVLLETRYGEDSCLPMYGFVMRLRCSVF